MKIKDFKEQLKNEQFDIPDVLDNIREIAYKKEFKKTNVRKFNFKIAFSLTPVLCILILGFFLMPQLTTGSDPYAPESAEFVSPENENINPESPNGITPEEIPGVTEKENPQQETNAYDTAEYVLYSAYYDDNEIPSSLLDTITLPNDCHESQECLVEFNSSESKLYFLSKEQFNYLNDYLIDNPTSSIEEIYTNISSKFNISEDNLYIILNAYTFIKEKIGDK